MPLPHGLSRVSEREGEEGESECECGWVVEWKRERQRGRDRDREQRENLIPDGYGLWIVWGGWTQGSPFSLALTCDSFPLTSPSLPLPPSTLSRSLPYTGTGEHWLGQRVRVFWKDDLVWYTGCIDDHLGGSDRYHILYDDDGMEEWLTLPTVFMHVLMVELFVH